MCWCVVSKPGHSIPGLALQWKPGMAWDMGLMLSLCVAPWQGQTLRL